MPCAEPIIFIVGRRLGQEVRRSGSTRHGGNLDAGPLKVDHNLHLLGLLGSHPDLEDTSRMKKSARGGIGGRYDATDVDGLRLAVAYPLFPVLHHLLALAFVEVDILLPVNASIGLI